MLAENQSHFLAFAGFKTNEINAVFMHSITPVVSEFTLKKVTLGSNFINVPRVNISLTDFNTAIFSVPDDIGSGTFVAKSVYDEINCLSITKEQVAISSAFIFLNVDFYLLNSDNKCNFSD